MFRLELLITLIFIFISVGATKDTIELNRQELDNLFDMSMEELMSMKITSASLGDLKKSLSPTDVILITSTSIQHSGARSLDEVLEIFVPSFNKLIKGKFGDAIGIRGIISDRNNKILLLVNGRIMNDRSLIGAFSERQITMLADIERIEVIQSPQSAMYGTGAISGIISIYTKTGVTSPKGVEVTSHVGLVDRFQNVQLRYGNTISDDMIYSIYYGVGYADGASSDDAPIRISIDTVDINGDTILSNNDMSFLSNNLNASGRVRHKAHAQFEYNDWKTWIRYVRGGGDYNFTQQQFFKKAANSDSLVQHRLEYSQLTALSEYTQTLGDFSFEGRVSYDDIGVVQRSKNRIDVNYLEKELYSRVLLKYSNNALSFAVGPSVSYEWLGEPADGNDQIEMVINSKLKGSLYDSTQSDSLNEYSEKWSTVMTSVVSEAQYLLYDSFKIVLGLRVDKHSYTGYLLSPRASMIWGDNDAQARLSYSRSNRRTDDGDLRNDYLNSGKTESNDIEIIDFYEASGHYTVFKGVQVSPSVFYGDYSVVGWGWSENKSVPIGELTYWGAEMKLEYRDRRNYSYISHSYIMPIDFILDGGEEAFPTNNVSNIPYGYGNSFHNYPDNIVKLYTQYFLSPELSLNASLQIFGKLYGAQDAVSHSSEIDSPVLNSSYTHGSNTAFEASYYLNMGMSYRVIEGLTINVHGYNLLGIINDNWNKRNEFQRNSQYRIQPLSAALQVNWGF
ncbi:MAG: TonB-dependent receptor plug domain-containing protein [Fibrobacterales bacterium]